MELTNSFEVERPVDEAWAVLTDVERIAPCLPGAQLQEIAGDEYRGIVKVKVGPITAQYKGKAVFVERDDTAHKAVIKADGRDTRGAGNASALITATATAVDEGRTRVDVNTDLTVTGKVAQFGRGVMADVSAKLMDQFAQNLSEMLESDGAGDGAGDEGGASDGEGTEAGAAAGADTGASGAAADTDEGVRRVHQPEPEAVDLLDAAGAPVLKRLLPVVAVIVALLVLRRLLRR